MQHTEAVFPKGYILPCKEYLHGDPGRNPWFAGLLLYGELSIH